MNSKEFISRIYIIFEDRNLKQPSEGWIVALFEKCKLIPDDDLNKGFDSIMSIPSEEWNRSYGFGGKPAITDWINFFTNRASKFAKSYPELYSSIKKNKFSAYQHLIK